MTMSRGTAVGFLVSLALVGAAVVAAIDPVAQDPLYHQFADQRALLGIANALDVLSNLPFLLVGFFGLAVVRRGGSAGWDRVIQSVLFASIALVALGSSYYHLAPDSERLVWDRVPMTLAFTSLFTLVISERISARAAQLLFIPMVLMGVWSVFYWYWGEQAGQGDLRFYGFVQFYPMLAIPLMLWLFPAKFTRGADLLIAVGWYLLAKVFELADGVIFDLGEVVSGHTLKHLSAAVACFYVARMIALREPTTQ